MAQDFLDYRAVADQADDFQRSGAAGTDQRVRFVHFLNQPRPRAADPTPELIGATGIFMVRRLGLGRLSRRSRGRMNPRPAHVGERAAVAHQLLSGIGNMRTQSGQEVERREDAGRGGLGITAPPALPAVVDDLAGFGAIAQALQGDRGMDHVGGQAPAGLVVVRIDPLALDRRKSPDASNSA